MSPKSNKIAEPQADTRENLPNKEGGFSKTTKEILGGDLLSTGTFKFFKYLLYLAFLAFIFIANNYYAENKIREINKLRKELKELRYEHINAKTRLMQIEKQSQIAKKLEKSGVKKNNQPVKILEVK